MPQTEIEKFLALAERSGKEFQTYQFEFTLVGTKKTLQTATLAPNPTQAWLLAVEEASRFNGSLETLRLVSKSRHPL